MAAVANTCSSIFNISLDRISDSSRLKSISFVALASLTVLMLAFSVWANFHVASQLGGSALLQHSGYTTLLPLSISALILRMLALNTACQQKASPSVATPADVEIYQNPREGKLVEMYVKVGDKVRSGDLLFKFEAMKMQSVERAHSDGKVTQILVKENTILDAGKAILTIEKPQST